MEQAENCPLEQKTVLYAYGELPDRDAMEIEKHLHTCGKCRVIAETLRGTEKIFSEKKDNPGDFSVRLIMSRAEEGKNTSEKSFLCRKAIAFALAALFIMSGYVLISYERENYWQDTAYIQNSPFLSDEAEDEDLDYLYEEISYSGDDFWE